MDAKTLLTDIGEKAVAFVQARAARMAARRERNRVAGEYQEEHGDPCCDGSEHPKHYSPAFIAATGEQQRAYEAALATEKSTRQRLYAAVRKFAQLSKDQP